MQIFSPLFPTAVFKKSACYSHIFTHYSRLFLTKNTISVCIAKFCWSQNVALPFQLQANFVLYKLGKTDYLLNGTVSY